MLYILLIICLYIYTLCSYLFLSPSFFSILLGIDVLIIPIALCHTHFLVIHDYPSVLLSFSSEDCSSYRSSGVHYHHRLAHLMSMRVEVALIVPQQRILMYLCRNVIKFRLSIVLMDDLTGQIKLIEIRIQIFVHGMESVVQICLDKTQSLVSH